MNKFFDIFTQDRMYDKWIHLFENTDFGGKYHFLYISKYELIKSKNFLRYTAPYSRDEIVLQLEMAGYKLVSRQQLEDHQRKLKEKFKRDRDWIYKKRT